MAAPCLCLRRVARVVFFGANKSRKLCVCRVCERARQRGRKVLELVVGGYIRGLVQWYAVDEMCLARIGGARSVNILPITVCTWSA